jgi:hypothetical protein
VSADALKLADTPDLGLRNHRFQNIASRFKAKRFYEGKTPVLAKSHNAANGEQKGSGSSTNSSTHAPDFVSCGLFLLASAELC